MADIIEWRKRDYSASLSPESLAVLQKAKEAIAKRKPRDDLDEHNDIPYKNPDDQHRQTLRDVL